MLVLALRPEPELLQPPAQARQSAGVLVLGLLLPGPAQQQVEVLVLVGRQAGVQLLVPGPVQERGQRSALVHPELRRIHLPRL